MIPIVYEGNHAEDIYSRLLKDRIVVIGGQITNDLANDVIAELLYLSSISNDEITIYINTPGGSVSDGLAIYDIMQRLEKKLHIRTVCIGMAASMGSILLVGGTPGKRQILPHGKVMIHQASGAMEGKCTDLMSSAKEIERSQSVLTDILVANSKMTPTIVKKKMQTDTWYSSQESVRAGLVDEILE